MKNEEIRRGGKKRWKSGGDYVARSLSLSLSISWKLISTTNRLKVSSAKKKFREREENDGGLEWCFIQEKIRGRLYK